MTAAALQRGVSGDLRGTRLGAVLVAPRGAPRADYTAALDALTRADKATPEVSLLPQTKEAALYYATHRPGRPVVVPFITGVDEFHAPDVGKKLRPGWSTSPRRTWPAPSASASRSSC